MAAKSFEQTDLAALRPLVSRTETHPPDDTSARQSSFQAAMGRWFLMPTFDVR